ncbi:MAG: amino acid permease [Chloroflexota bacterium]
MSEITELIATQAESKPASKAGTLTNWVSFWTVITLALAGVGLVQATWLPISILPGVYPGINITSVVLIGLGSMLVVLLTIWTMGRLVGREAPDYFFGTRVIHPLFGFAFSWTFLIGGALFIGFLASLFARLILPDLANLLGNVLGIYDLQVFAASLHNPQVMVYLASGLIFAAFLLSILSPQAIRRIFNWGVGISILGWLVVLGQFAAVSPNRFSEFFDRIFGAGSHALHLNLAFQLGMKAQGETLPEMIAIGLVLGLFGFFALGLPVWMSAELRTHRRNLVPAGLLALIIVGFLVIAAIGLVERTVSWQFLAAESFLRLKGITGEGGVVLPMPVSTPAGASTGVLRGIILPWLPFYAAVIQPNPLVLFSLSVVWVVMFVLVVQAYMLTLSRVLKAWADDRLVPEWIGLVHARQHSPLFSLLVVTVIALFVVIDSAQANWIANHFNFGLFVAFGLLLPVLALIKNPYYFLKEGEDRPSKGWVRFLGVVTLIIFLAAIVLPYVFQVKILAVDWQSGILLGLVFFSGMVWFGGRSLYLKSRGVTLTTLFKKPEDKSQ